MERRGKDGWMDESRGEERGGVSSLYIGGNMLFLDMFLY